MDLNSDDNDLNQNIDQCSENGQIQGTLFLCDNGSP